LLGLGYLAAALALLIVALNLTWLRSDLYATWASRQASRERRIPGERGAILDRKGRPLALSLLGYAVASYRPEVARPAEEAEQLAPLLGMDRSTLVQRMMSGEYVYLARRLPPERALEIEKLSKEGKLPGILLEPDPRRIYPAGATSLLGFVGADGRGLEGLEYALDAVLTGASGETALEESVTGRLPLPGGARMTPTRRGADVVLSIDEDLQAVAEVALSRAVERTGARGGCVLVFHLEEGDLLAAASWTAPHAQGGPSPSQNFCFNRAYEPGSAMKAITFAGLLATGLALDQKVEVPPRVEVGGWSFHDAEPHPRRVVTVEDVIAESSNVGTILLARRLGADGLLENMRRLGLGSPTGVGFPGEAAGILPGRDGISASTWATLAIGQGVAVTPLQMVQALGAVATGGSMVRPRLLREVVREGRREPVPSRPPLRVLGPEVAKELTRALEAVVARGTGQKAAVPGYRVAGKTGTARKPRPDGKGYGPGYLASFYGFAPVSRPVLVVGVVLDEPTPIWGGEAAAPVFREVMARALGSLGIPPDEPPPPSQG
jgi:cell division protein FtsI (penicillin-binding protein 3)